MAEVELTPCRMSLGLFLLLISAGFCISQDIPSLNVDDFPLDFVLGAGSSAYQVEGAVAEDGRTPSIWDTYTHAGKMVDKSNPDVSADQYHKYKEDVKLMRDMGLDAYRFSISWSRLIPNGRGAVNPKGLRYYNNLINELIRYGHLCYMGLPQLALETGNLTVSSSLLDVAGIQPHLTLYHFDLPQILEDEYGGWLSPKIVEDFTSYADVCFREFGDRIPHWTTINQANILAIASYDNGLFPPSRCSAGFGSNCAGGNSSVEPYIAVHHVLLAHASAAALYREKYQAKQKGLIGLNLYGTYYTPYSNSTEDVEAAQRALDFNNGWIINPLVFGDYPEVMKKNAGSRIPSFTKSESKLVKGSFDFIGLNHYITAFAKDDPEGPKKKIRDYNADIFAKYTYSKDVVPNGQILPTRLPFCPSGLQGLLEYMRDQYENPPVYVHENGRSFPYNETLNDIGRIDYINAYINATLNAISNGANVKGYFVWSFLDVFELVNGYTQRYGLYHVDFEDKARTRKPKLSAHWFSNLLKEKKEARIRKMKEKKEAKIRKIGQQSMAQ